MTAISINGDRLWASLMSLAEIGGTPAGGVARLALTDLDRQGRERVIGWAQEAGCTIRVDQIGNIFARRPGRENDALAVASGSHIDTQPTGGKFDGNYGVLAVLEVFRTLNDHDIQTRLPLEMAIWTNEEGSRFVPVMMGSGVYAGAFTLETALAAVDREGISVESALKAIGYAGDTPAAVSAGAPLFAAYFEAHIEQGPVLEDADVVIGAVTGALGQRWYDITVTGQEAHAGPTPMALRRDALQAATKLMQETVAVALRHAPHGRGTVGTVDVFPSSRNVIPGRVKFTADLRNIDDETLSKMDAEIRAACAEVAAATKTKVDIEQVVYFPPTAFAPELVDGVRQGAKARGYSCMDVVSGAGHDAVYVASQLPVGMIFVPCKDGISHNEVEDAKPEHLTAGCNVLLDAMLLAAA
ncbi:Zn-dependent hydrolase [Variovorax sp. ZT4R33]|uniref:Zn-dependent hydrolase n=1 Tax=Variovorax sp. ZT4R33 TaxID=3443743 RepID=UPI003F45DAA0